MFGKNVAPFLCKTKDHFLLPKRNWTQVGHVICTPPRVKCSYPEKLLHVLFMFTVWFVPCAYNLTQIKVWRRKYIE